MKRFLMPVLLLAAASPAAAQQGGPVVGSVTPRYAELSGWLVKTAEQVPESLYAFKPNPAVRSLGQLIGHVANAQFMFCAAAMGEKSPQAQDYEKVTDKASLVAAIKASAAYCDRAYKMSDADAMLPTKLFGSMTLTRLGALIFNATHDGEHYGNLVVYMRLNGITPPSSQQSGN
jgi:uncharacterized damage-inducible protein DinB